MRELPAIHADRDQVREAIANAGQGTDVSQWQVEEMRYTDELAEATTYWEKQENTAIQVGYSIDNVTFEGLTIAEIITDDTQFKLIRNGFQGLMVHQAECHDTNTAELKVEIEELNECIHAHELERERLQTANTELEVKNYELGLVNDELNEKVRKVAELQHESNQQIEQQKQHIDELQKQLALGVRGALNVVDVPQDTSKMAAEIIARKVRITNVRFKDENGIDLRLKLAEVVLTGEPIEYEAIYEKRYIIQNSTEAEQYRADEANKKAEQEQLANSIPVTQEPEVQPVNAVMEEVEAAENQPFQENGHELGERLQLDGQHISHEVPEKAEESEVVTRAEHEALKFEVTMLAVELKARGILPHAWEAA